MGFPEMHRGHHRSTSSRTWWHEISEAPKALQVLASTKNRDPCSTSKGPAMPLENTSRGRIGLRAFGSTAASKDAAFDRPDLQWVCPSLWSGGDAQRWLQLAPAIGTPNTKYPCLLTFNISLPVSSYLCRSAISSRAHAPFVLLDSRRTSDLALR